MIIGHGIDLADPARLRAAAERSDGRILARLFTGAERTSCERAASPWSRYASRFAAKEAFLKALGTGLRGGLSWQQVEVVSDELGKPSLRLHGRALELVGEMGVSALHLSLSDLDGLSIASVILEKA